MLHRFLNALAFGLAVLSGAAVFFMMALTAVDVTLRFFGGGVRGTTDIVENYFMLAAGFLPLAYVERRDGMIAVDAVFALVGAMQKPVYLFATLYSAIVYAALTYATGALAWKKIVTGAYLDQIYYHLPVWPGFAMVPLSLGLTTILVLLRAVSLFRGGLVGRHDPAASVGEAPGAGEAA